MTLVEEIAQLLYSEDSTVPWPNTDQQEREYYYGVADVLIDAVTTHLDNVNESFAGALRVAIDYLRTETEVARLRRMVRK